MSLDIGLTDDAGAINETMQLAMRLDDAIDRRLQLCRMHHIGRRMIGLAAGFLDAARGLFGARLMLIDARNGDAVSCKELRRRLADAARRTDHRNRIRLPVEIVHNT